MADTIYRSVKLVLQNSTNEMLTVQGVATLVGEWTPKMAPVQGQQIPEQSAAEFQAQSTRVGFGVFAFVRFSSSTGYTTLRWHLPWTGAFKAEILERGTTEPHLEVDDSHPDHVVVLAMLTDRQPLT